MPREEDNNKVIDFEWFKKVREQPWLTMTYEDFAKADLRFLDDIEFNYMETRVGIGDIIKRHMSVYLSECDSEYLSGMKAEGKYNDELEETLQRKLEIVQSAIFQYGKLNSTFFRSVFGLIEETNEKISQMKTPPKQLH